MIDLEEELKKHFFPWYQISKEKPERKNLKYFLSTCSSEQMDLTMSALEDYLDLLFKIEYYFFSKGFDQVAELAEGYCEAKEISGFNKTAFQSCISEVFAAKKTE